MKIRLSRQARYKFRKPWVRFVEYARRRVREREGYKAISCDLTAAQLQTIWERDVAGKKMAKPSLDRINPRGDYTLANVRFVEHLFNSRRAWDPELAYNKENENGATDDTTQGAYVPGGGVDEGCALGERQGSEAVGEGVPF